MEKAIEGLTTHKLTELSCCVDTGKTDNKTALVMFIGYIGALKDAYLLSTKEYGELLCVAKEKLK